MKEFSKYPSYKSSGVEWLGDVPSHWNSSPLRYLLSSPLKYGANEVAVDEDNTQPRYVRITDVAENGTLRPETFKSLDWNIAKDYLLEEGDILFARSGATVGKTFMYRADWGTSAFAGYLIRARLDAKKLIANFAQYCTTSDFYKCWISSNLVQATIQNVSADKYATLVLPLPPLPEQKAIAAFLDRETARIDGLIGKREKLTALLQEKRAALISHAVTKGLDPKTKMKPSGIDWFGDIPVHWEVSPLRYLLSSPLKYGANECAIDEDTTQPRYVRITDVAENGTLRPETFKSLDWNIAKDYLLEEGDILFARSGATVGKTFMYRSDWGTSAFAGYLIRARLDVKKVVANFAQYCTTSDFYKGWISSILVQATIQNVSADKYATFSFPWPPLSEQEAIAAHLDSETKKIDGLMEREQQIIERMKEYRSALISAAVTGKIDVREGV